MMTADPQSIQKLSFNLLVRNLHQETFEVNNTISKAGRKKDIGVSNVTWNFSAPCSSVSEVQESTSTLLAARAFAKAGYVVQAWESLLSFFQGQHEDGFLPMFRYSPHIEDNQIYIENSTIPGPYIGLHLASLPMHASIVLDVFAMSNQTQEDVSNLQILYTNILKYHQWIQDNQMFVHPWETLWSTKSWVQPLADVRLEMQSKNWKVPFEVPIAVKQSYKYISDVYEPSIYLLQECREKEVITSASCALHFDSVDRTAILVRAYEDLMQMRAVLRGRYVEVEEFPDSWLENSQKLLSSLWNEYYQTYLPQRTFNSTETYEWIVEPDASIFVGLWADLKNESRVYNMASKLMQREDDNFFFFDCGIHAVWSIGGCDPSSAISPLLNYLITAGLQQNGAGGMEYYISNATTNRLFGNDTTDFAEAFQAPSGKPFHNMDSCSLSSTATAAIVYDLSTGFVISRSFLVDPPIRNSSVIVLVLIELVIAFSIGASCLLLNLKLLRQEFRESQQLQHEQEEIHLIEDGGYYSAANSIDGDNEHDGNASIKSDDEAENFLE
mmetsp:Transcript_24366/g.36145  ORF Transcript_24366/g.36145 Transcript_24366/m.36145 type:complete len:555 (+) Transcript_24366:159-1823(+)